MITTTCTGFCIASCNLRDNRHAASNVVQTEIGHVHVVDVNAPFCFSYLHQYLHNGRLASSGPTDDSHLRIMNSISVFTLTCTCTCTECNFQDILPSLPTPL